MPSPLMALVGTIAMVLAKSFTLLNLSVLKPSLEKVLPKDVVLRKVCGTFNGISLVGKLVISYGRRDLE